MAHDSHPVVHPLLSCSSSPPWRFWWHILQAASPSGAPCAGKGSANATATAFHYAMDFVRIFLPQMSYVFQQQAVFFVLCEKLDALTRDNWMEDVPIPDFEGEVMHMTASSLGVHLPCLFGWVAALVCELRVQQDVLNGLWDSDLEVFLQRSVPKLSQNDQNDEEDEILAALRGKDHRASAQLQSRGRWILRDLLHGGHRGLSLLDSSGWATLSHVLELLPAGELGPANEGAAFALQQSFIQQVTSILGMMKLPGHPDQQHILRRGPVKVWAASLHPTLLLEPLSLWKQTLSLTALLSTTQCFDVPDITCEETLQDLFADLSTREDGLGHFPLVHNFEEFSLIFSKIAQDHLATNNFLVCGEPAFLCWILQNFNAKPVLGYLGNPLGAYLNAENQISFYDFISETPQLTTAMNASFQLVFMSPPLAASAYWQTGVRIPVLRPVADYLATGASYGSDSNKVLITKQVFTFWDFRCILNQMGQGYTSPWQFQYISHLEDSWKALPSFRAAVMLPYDAQTLVFYELYSFGMPLLVPNEMMLPLFFMRSYGQDGGVAIQRPGWSLKRQGVAWGRWHQGSFNELRWWAMFSDIARMPHLLFWSSLAQLFSLLGSPMSAISTKMLQLTKQHRKRSLEFWSACIG